MAGLFDYEFQLERINKHQPPLQKLDKIIDWDMFREPIEKALQKENRKSNAGRKSYDKLLMFKILILQRYYNLSDEQTEFQIKDRLSFLQFLGLQIGDNVPDEKTIWLFKEKLKDKDLSKKLFELFTSKLITNGVIAKEGTMVDASFVSVPKQRNKKSDNDIIKKDEIPQSFKDNPSKLSQKDCDARWTKDLVDENDNIFYADSAYKSKEIEEYLKEKNVKSKVIKRAYRNKPLTNAEHKENYKHSKTRVRVEHIFGTLTSQMNNALNLTSVGINRIKSTIGLMNLTYNLVRYEQLVRLKKVKIV
jgi:IS5 family transposase